MKPDQTKTVVLDTSHRIEIGPSSWDPAEVSLRNRYDSPQTGRFSPHGSSESPLHDLVPLLRAAADHDLLRPIQCAQIVEALSQSLARQLHS